MLSQPVSMHIRKFNDGWYHKNRITQQQLIYICFIVWSKEQGIGYWVCDPDDGMTILSFLLDAWVYMIP